MAASKEIAVAPAGSQIITHPPTGKRFVVIMPSRIARSVAAAHRYHVSPIILGEYVPRLRRTA